MIRSYTLLIILLLLNKGTALYSQQLSHQVLVPAAGVIAVDEINYSQTIGEPVVEIITGSEFIFTQGFQQPRMRLDPGKLSEGNGVEVYPNPVINDLTVKLFGEISRNFTLEIINLTGTVVYLERIYFSSSYYL